MIWGHPDALGDGELPVVLTRIVSSLIASPEPQSQKRFVRKAFTFASLGWRVKWDRTIKSRKGPVVALNWSHFWRLKGYQLFGDHTIWARFLSSARSPVPHSLQARKPSDVDMYLSVPSRPIFQPASSRSWLLDTCFGIQVAPLRMEIGPIVSLSTIK